MRKKKFYIMLIVIIIFKLIQVERFILKQKSRFSKSSLLIFRLEFVDLWRKISVEGLDDKKILDFLDTHGHYGLKKNAPQQAVS